MIKDLSDVCKILSKYCDKTVCPLALICGHISACNYDTKEKSQFETDKEKNNEQIQ